MASAMVLRNEPYQESAHATARFVCLATSDARAGAAGHRADGRVRPVLRPCLTEAEMIWITAIVTVLLLAYLLVALLRPEWF